MPGSIQKLKLISDHAQLSIILEEYGKWMVEGRKKSGKLFQVSLASSSMCVSNRNILCILIWSYHWESISVTLNKSSWSPIDLSRLKNNNQ